MSDGQRQLETYINDMRPRYEDMLGQAVEIPSISMDPGMRAGCAPHGRARLHNIQDAGAEAHIVETLGIRSCRRMDDRPCISHRHGLQSHGCPAAQEPEMEWQAPFAFRMTNGIYWGRGATDDKAALAALFGAGDMRSIRACRSLVRSLWELKKKTKPQFCGSYRIAAILRLTLVILDDLVSEKSRCLCWLGIARCAARPSNWNQRCAFRCDRRAVRNPLVELMDIAHACVDAKTGKRLIPGFTMRLIPPTKAEIASFQVGLSGAHIQTGLWFKTLRTENPGRRSCGGFGPRRRSKCMG